MPNTVNDSGTATLFCAESVPTLSLAGLIAAFRTDPDSPLVKPGKLRYVTKQSYLRLISRIDLDHGHEALDELRGRDFLRWHERWSEGGKVHMGHGLMGMLRTLFSFGAAILDNAECMRLSLLLSKQKFEMGKPRSEQIIADQAVAVRAELHNVGLHSVAFAQSMQFDFTWRQKDAIGEWLPLSEPGISATLWHGQKWLRGACWEEMDDNFVLTHTTSKKLKKVVIDVRLAVMVMEELHLIAGVPVGACLSRNMLPARGPMVVSELTDLPWKDAAFRKLWREAATACGIPTTTFNMDSRAGAITEGLEATGGDLDAVRITATHRNVTTTQGYSRGEAKRMASVMKTRADYRAANKGA